VVASLSAAALVLLVTVALTATLAAFRIGAARNETLAEAEKNRHRLVESYVANGVRLMDEGDLLGALPWLAEALKEEKRDAARHRVLLANVLAHCPRLVHVWRPRGAVTHAEFSPTATGWSRPAPGRRSGTLPRARRSLSSHTRSLSARTRTA